ncbi:MAG: M20/M25/M40 family metallo-hydrolase [Thermoanaerobaculia bacterium]
MERLLDHLRGRRDEMVALLRELAAMESPSRSPEAQEPLFARLAAELRDVGLRPRRLSGPPGKRLSGGQMFAAPPHPRKPGQLLVGHCDTVWPVGTLDGMPVELRDGRLYGPGTYDMKAGLVQGIFALRAIRDLGLEPPLAPAFFINSDEELGSLESADRVRRLARRVRRVFVLEPSLGPEGRLKTARKGVWRFRVTVRGRAAHSGLDPEKGASAVLALAHLVQALYALADPTRGVTVNVGVIGGGVTFNVVAPEAWAEVDVRVLRGEDGEAFERALQRLKPAVPGTSFEVTGGMNRYPLEPNPRNRALWHAAERCARRLGLELGEGTAGGGSDGNFTSEHAATLDGLGAVGDGAHAVHEHVVIDRMPERAALLAGLLLEPVV